jgi:hypothetical protein
MHRCILACYLQIDEDPDFYLMQMRMWIRSESKLPKLCGSGSTTLLTTERMRSVVGRKVNFTHRGAAALLFCTTVMAVVVNGLRLLRSTKLEEYLLGVRYVGIIIPFASSTRARHGYL